MRDEGDGPAWLHFRPPVREQNRRIGDPQALVEPQQLCAQRPAHEVETPVRAQIGKGIVAAARSEDDDWPVLAERRTQYGTDRGECRVVILAQERTEIVRPENV